MWRSADCWCEIHRPTTVWPCLRDLEEAFARLFQLTEAVANSQAYKPPRDL